VINFIINVENLRTLFLFIAMIAGIVWLDRRVDQKIAASEDRQNKRMDGLFTSLHHEMDGLGTSLRQEMDGLGTSLRQEMNGLAVSLRQEMSDLAVSLRQEMSDLAVSLRQEMSDLAASLRQEMDERFIAFHKMLKENDFAHLNKTIEALTFMLQKNGFLKPEDKTFIDSHLDGR